MSNEFQVELEFDSTHPIYLQIVDEVKRAAARHVLAPGARLPSQRDLAWATRVNPNTVQRAYREMESMGLVETRRGEGTFITQDVGLLSALRSAMAQAAVETFVRQIIALGLAEAEAIALVREVYQTTGDQEGSWEHDRQDANSD